MASEARHGRVQRSVAYRVVAGGGNERHSGKSSENGPGQHAVRPEVKGEFGRVGYKVCDPVTERAQTSAKTMCEMNE